MSPLMPKLIISGLFGLFDGFISYFALLLMEDPEPVRFALIMGLAAFALMLLFLLLKEEMMARRFEKAEKLLPGQPQLYAGANLRQDRKIASVKMYIYRDEVYLINVHQREPIITRIARHNVSTAQMESTIQLNLTLNDGQVLMLLSPYMEALVHQLRCNAWCISGKME